MPATSAIPVCFTSRLLVGCALAGALAAGAVPAHAQQASAAVAVSVTVVRSATIDVPTTALLNSGVPAQTAAASITIRPNSATLPTAPARTTLPTAGAKSGLPVVAPPADGRPLSIQF